MDPPTMWSDALDLPATAEGVERLDRWLAGHCAARALGPALSNAVRLCAAELAANVIEHGRRDRGGGSLSVRLSHGADVRLEIADDGNPFDPTVAIDPPMPTSIDTAPDHGYGLRLVRGFARDFRYRRDAGRNVVSLTFGPSPAR